MTITRRLLNRPWRSPVSTPIPETEPALGVWEADLDIHHGHFGPVSWSSSWAQWQESLRRDQPTNVFLVAETYGERRLLAILKPEEIQPSTLAADGFACLKYYRYQHGASVAVCLAIETLKRFAD